MQKAELPEFKVFGEYWNSINGCLTTTSQRIHGINPATTQSNPPVPVSTQDDVDAALSAAQAAFKMWSRKSYSERKLALEKFAMAVECHRDDFAQLLSQEQGKPIKFAKGEVEASTSWMRQISNFELKEEVRVDDDETKVILRYTPLGVVVGIVPWNFPLIQVLAKITPAIITGNTILVKPSPYTPYCALKLGELAQQFFPPGVVQVLSGDDRLGELLTNHHIPAKISFTGSSATGKLVMAAASQTLKSLTLELGGNDPAIVRSDIDIDTVAPKIAEMSFLNSGQICLAIKRIFVHADIFEAFSEVMIDHMHKLKVGEGHSDDVFLGPVQNQMQYERVHGILEDSKKNNHQIIMNNGTSKGPGYFINPAVVLCPPDDSRIVTEEPFGPVVPILQWRDEEDVINRANSSSMGLGASVWTKDLTAADRIARQLEAGSVWVNNHFQLHANVPNGGHKQSGIGVEGSKEGLKEFCNVQAIFWQK